MGWIRDLHRFALPCEPSPMRWAGFSPSAACLPTLSSLDLALCHVALMGCKENIWYLLHLCWGLKENAGNIIFLPGTHRAQPQTPYPQQYEFAAVRLLNFTNLFVTTEKPTDIVDEEDPIGEQGFTFLEAKPRETDCSHSSHCLLWMARQ